MARTMTKELRLAGMAPELIANVERQRVRRTLSATAKVLTGIDHIADARCAGHRADSEIARGRRAVGASITAGGRCEDRP
jgi:hypothetical protein